jgi:lipid-binding SYLF domain-containing protein
MERPVGADASANLAAKTEQRCLKRSRGKTTMFRNALCAVLIAMSLLAGTSASRAASAYDIDVGVDATLDRFFHNVRGARELADKSVGILVFPSVVKAGFGFGGEYGEGALRIRGRTVDYYNTVSASIGFQLGIQERSVIIMFMTPEALDQFRRTAGWKVGADASVAIVTVGVGGSIDTNKITSPVVGFILDPKGLMYNLTLEGTKITRINPR